METLYPSARASRPISWYWPGSFGLHPGTETPGRKVVRHIGESLVEAMEMALKAGPPEAAELVAAECVTLAETKDHLNWELLGLAAAETDGSVRAVRLDQDGRHAA